MRKTALALAACIAVFIVVLSTALASGPPSRTPDAKAIPKLSQATVTLSQGIKQTQAKYGRVIEAKFELDDSGALSLSIYAAPSGYDVFKEVSGSPTSAPWKPSAELITAREDLVNSAFDLTILEEGRVGLAAAVRQALAKQPGTAYWAVPTLHGKRPAIGIYIRSTDGKSHHVYIPVR